MVKKIVLMGRYGVGKTSLVSRFVDNTFSDKYLSSIGVNISKKQIYLNNTIMQLMIWDIAGESKLNKASLSYLKGASGVIYTIDTGRPDTYFEASQEIKMLNEITGYIPLAIAANKIDISQGKPDWILKTPNDIPLFETSAKTGNNVDSVFDWLSKKMLENACYNEKTIQILK